MALEKATQSMPFVQGADTKTDPNLAQKPAAVENGVFRGGSIQKRPGRSSLPTAIAGGGTQTAGEALVAYGDALLRINGGTVYGLTEASDQWMAAPGAGNFANVEKQQLVRNSATQGNPDHVVVNGIGVLAYTVSSGGAGGAGVHLMVYDAATGAVYQTGAAVVSGMGNGQAPKLVVLGSKVVLLAQANASTSLFSTTIDLASPTTLPAAAATIKNDVYNGSFTFDAFTHPAGYGVVVYAQSGTDLGVFALSQTGAVLASPAGVTLAGVAGAAGLTRAILANKDTAGNIYIVFGDVSANRTRFTVLTATFAVSVATTNIVTTGNWSGTTADADIGVSVESSTNNVTFILANTRTIAGSVFTAYLAKVVLGPAGIVTAFAEMATTQGMWPVAGLVPYAGTFVFGAVNLEAVNISYTTYGTAQSTAFVIDISGSVVARALMYVSGVSGAPYVRACQSSGFGNSASLIFGEQERTAFASSGGTVLNVTPMGITKVTVAKLDASRLPVTRVGPSVYLGGALPRMFDGQTVCETGFATAPPVLSIVLAGAGGQLSAGTYQWSFLYSWVNAKGELVRGLPSTPVSKVAVANNSATITLLTMPESMRDLLPIGAQVVIEAYRTEANGSVLHRQSSVVAPTLNSTTATTIVITDATNDTDVAVGEFIYTTGGVLDWEAPPPYSAACAHKNRLIVLPAEDPYSWAPSSEWAPGETVRFSQTTVNHVPADKGPLVNCATMDGKLILLAEKGAYVVVGDGPDLLGQNNYPPPERVISVDEGPIPGTPIVETPMGLIFQGPSGITLLDRALNTSFIGAEVEAWTTGLWRTRSAILDSANQEVRFLVDMGSDLPGMQMGTLTTTLSGMVLVYNYYYQQWCWWPSYGGRSACFYQDAFALVQSDGVVWQEQPATYREAGDYYSTVVETPWIKMAGVQGFQRIFYAMVLGTYGSDFTLKWEVAYDYDGTSPTAPTWEDPEYLDGEGIYTVGAPFQVRMHLGRKCAAVKFRFTDIELRGDGRGMALSDLSFEFGTKKGVFKLPATKTAAAR
jgi:hypothetical protein